MMIRLPWPNRQLSQNARVHWAVRARLTAAARHTAAVLAREALGRNSAPPAPVRLTCTFQAPDARRRDRSNMIGLMKAYEDGIADAMRVDDANFIWTYQVGQPVKGGAVIVEVEE